MNDFFRMNILERTGDLQRDPDLVFQIAGVLLADRIPQGEPAQELHDDERLAALFPVVEDADNVVVADVAGQPGFLNKTLLSLRILASGLGQHLQSDGPPKHRIHGAVHVRHPSTEEFHQFVLANTRRKLHRTPLQIYLSSHTGNQCGVLF